jgi:hypothetical protein
LSDFGKFLNLDGTPQCFGSMVRNKDLDCGTCPLREDCHKRFEAVVEYVGENANSECKSNG